MIRVYNSLQRVGVHPTVFPDGTSQVWKLNIEEFGSEPVNILWEYEEEREVLWIIQLLTLLRAERIKVEELYIPYFPYARQDKIISNEATFARYPFAIILETFAGFVGSIKALDIHSPLGGVESISPEKFIREAIKHSKADIIVFPDAGAATRYLDKISNFPDLILTKDRDQSSGLIRGLCLADCQSNDVTVEKINTTGRKVNYLIVDDICDGGMTFIKAAEFLKTFNNTGDIDLYVTHGIYSKGLNVLHEAGIRNNYTTRSLNRFRINRGLGEFGSLLGL